MKSDYIPRPDGNRANERERNGYDRRRQKNPFERRGKAPPKPQHPKLPAHVLKQIGLRPFVESVCEKAGLTKQGEHKRGTDYTFRFQRKGIRKTIKVDLNIVLVGLVRKQYKLD